MKYCHWFVQASAFYPFTYSACTTPRNLQLPHNRSAPGTPLVSCGRSRSSSRTPSSDDASHLRVPFRRTRGSSLPEDMEESLSRNNTYLLRKFDIKGRKVRSASCLLPCLLAHNRWCTLATPTTTGAMQVWPLLRGEAGLTFPPYHLLPDPSSLPPPPCSLLPITSSLPPPHCPLLRTPSSLRLSPCRLLPAPHSCPHLLAQELQQKLQL